MLLKALILSVTAAVTLSVITSDARAWGCSRSCSFSGSYGYGGGGYHGSRGDCTRGLITHGRRPKGSFA
jgi:hypothetical protein